MTNKLQQIEQLRQELVKRILEITGLPASDVEVQINFHNQDNNCPLAVEARQLDWFPDRHEESAWYTSAMPDTGSTTVFVE